MTLGAGNQHFASLQAHISDFKWGWVFVGRVSFLFLVCVFVLCDCAVILGEGHKASLKQCCSHPGATAHCSLPYPKNWDEGRAPFKRGGAGSRVCVGGSSPPPPPPSGAEILEALKVWKKFFGLN